MSKAAATTSAANPANASRGPVEAAHGRSDAPLRVGIAFGMLGVAVVAGAVVGLSAGE